MKKVYCKNFKYWIYQSLFTHRTLVLENNGKFGVDRLEAQITYTNGCFNLVLTDGYRILKSLRSDKGLKTLMNLAHGYMAF